MSEKYSELNAEKILSTLHRLEFRIRERFPKSGLLHVCQEFNVIAKDLELLAYNLKKPIWWVRISTWAFVVILLFILIAGVRTFYHSLHVDQTGILRQLSLSDFFQATESAINDAIFFSLAAYFMIMAETRIKRRKSLKALHQLRSLAHVIDMHQLTKDPVIITKNLPTDSSPERIMSPFELSRYLDYCSEMLSIINKIGAIFSQNLLDEVVLRHVNDLSELTVGLSAKIWQKIMIMEKEIN
jgi:hypothetical protein